MWVSDLVWGDGSPLDAASPLAERSLTPEEDSRDSFQSQINTSSREENKVTPTPILMTFLHSVKISCAR